MNVEELRALAELRFDWSPTKEDVWAAPEAHVEGMNSDVAAAILSAFDQPALSPGGSPLGVVVEGQHGAGKTHLLTWVRERFQRDGGYFFLLGLPGGREFWQTLVQAYLDGLTRPTGAAMFPDQWTRMMEGLADRAAVSDGLREQICGREAVTREALDEFVDSLKSEDRRLGRDVQQTLRALVLFNATDTGLRDLGDEFLTSRTDGALVDEWLAWGLPALPRSPQETVAEISRLLALTGPSLLAVDQIDTIFAHARRSVLADTESTSQEPAQVVQVAEEFGYGLMQAREALHRTVTVVSCLPTTWRLICTSTLESIPDRFRQETPLSRIPSAEIGRALVAARFGPRFAAIGFVPPYPTWPVAEAAFRDAPDLTPRQLFQRVDAHVRDCVRRQVVRPLTDLSQNAGAPSDPPPEQPTITAERIAAFDARLAALYAAADEVRDALVPEHEDTEMPRLLTAGLQAWVRERGRLRERYEVLPGPGSRSVHATLREIVDEEMADYNFWFIRGLARVHHSAVLPRIEWVRRFAALDADFPQRRAVLLRNGRWPNGPKTTLRIQEFENAGGSRREVSEEDLRTFSALATMLADDDPGLDAWLVLRQPASSTKVFTEIFGFPPEDSSATPPPPPSSGPGPAPRPTGDQAPGSAPHDRLPGLDAADGAGDATDSIALGAMVGTGEPVRIELRALRKHTAIFAGSGSGKTVLIRRLIEECALQGVSTIALDPNNDLARLGDPWPQPPATWGPRDADRATDYLDATDVVVWTPRRESGRPLSLQPLPDFSAVLDDPDEFELALDTAVAALAPRARMGGATAKMERGRAVLREALSYFARRRSSVRLNSFVDFLADLPEEVTSLGKAADLAYDMAQTLTAAMINDPLFGGAGVPLDPGVLLTPAAGKRARISVISFVGLPRNDQRQSFVNQLQMALFAWIKQNPAGDRPLGGLFVMDEAQTLAPSGAMTACTESTLALASQARKYGLGLVFATQAPKGIHNRIVGNSATQFYGFLNSPVQIAAAKEMAQAKASGVLDISRLTAGEFYSMGEGMPFRKLAAPMCLSHHPSSALTTEEVLRRARE